jgi:glycogen operon protein
VSFAGYDKATGADDLVYVAVNPHWEDVRITLPSLTPSQAWYLSVNTYGDERNRYCYPEGQEVRIEHEFIMRPRSVAVFTGRDI